MSEWYYQLAREEIGPISASELRQLRKEGTLSRDSLVRKGKEGKWVLANNVKGLFDSPPATPKVASATAGPDESDELRLAPVREAVSPTTAKRDAKRPPPPPNAPSYRCPKCREEVDVTLSVCLHCGFNLNVAEYARPSAVESMKEREKAREGENVDSLAEFYAGIPIYAFRCLNRFDWLDALLQVAKVVAGILVIAALIAVINSSAAVLAVAASVGMIVAVAVCVAAALLALAIQIAFEELILGLCLLTLGLPFPNAERTMRVLSEVVISKWMAGVMFVGFGVFILPLIGLVGVWGLLLFALIQIAFYLALPASLYSQRLDFPMWKALVISGVTLSINLVMSVGAQLLLLAMFFRQ
jgi:hypothetical protein